VLTTDLLFKLAVTQVISSWLGNLWPLAMIRCIERMSRVTVNYESRAETNICIYFTVQSFCFKVYDCASAVNFVNYEGSFHFEMFVSPK